MNRKFKLKSRSNKPEFWPNQIKPNTTTTWTPIELDRLGSVRLSIGDFVRVSSGMKSISDYVRAFFWAGPDVTTDDR